ncbi:DUF2059 domain-containing protein [Thalassotalea sp. LPB0316]|uniref:DUF2059 domain-containing protein n=1 Tax=Thalassotalea sp. LPB0316 TaxID=2769490 RepID=UPI0018691E00|nr:DUF2059 domain-containing protein [Thalassotalea sp. LPB0316]QOL26658.1 DUF2059 domain-containing protein [Thalassotalea sp. LPB0316]
MKKLTSFIGATLVALSSVVTFTTSAQGVSDSQVYQLLDKSGSTRAIESIPMQMQAMGQQLSLTAKDQQEHQEFMELLVNSMNTDEMLSQMLASIKKSMTSEDIEDVLAWLNSDIGERVVTAELKSAEPEFQQEFMMYAAQLQSTPPSQARKQVIMDLVEKSQMVDQGMNLITGIIKNMFDAVKSKTPEDQELASTLDSQLDMMTRSLRPAIEQQMILTSYYIYQDISNEDIATYTSFFEQPTGKKYITSMYDAVGVAMSSWGTNLMTDIVAKYDQDSESTE